MPFKFKCRLINRISKEFGSPYFEISIIPNLKRFFTKMEAKINGYFKTTGLFCINGRVFLDIGLPFAYGDILTLTYSIFNLSYMNARVSTVKYRLKGKKDL